MPVVPDDLPPLEELQDAAYVVRLPMRVRFRGLLEREVLLLEGPRGWGEFGAFVEYGDDEAARWLAAAVEGGWGSWPAPVREAVPVNATVPAVSAAEVAGVLARFPGARTAKIKVAEAGQTVTDDIARVSATVDALGGTGARLRVDANGGWSVEDAMDALPRLAAAAGSATFEYAEQPCAGIEELARLRVGLARSGHDIRVAADESVRKAEDPLRVAVSGAADVVIVKVAPLGGVRPALAVAEQLGRQHGLPVVVSSALDSSVGIGAGLALAAALPELPFDCGLATVGLFERDVAEDPLLPQSGSIPVRRAVADPDRLRALAAPSERQAWWRARMQRAYRVLAPAGGR